MVPDPLHPAVVHFPIVLAFLLPIFALGALWAIRRGARPGRAWAIPLAVALALVGSAWLALETGEGEEDRVEGVAGFAVGRAGGELVYRHGAAQPYVTTAAAGAPGAAVQDRNHEEEDED